MKRTSDFKCVSNLKERHTFNSYYNTHEGDKVTISFRSMAIRRIEVTHSRSTSICPHHPLALTNPRPHWSRRSCPLSACGKQRTSRKRIWPEHWSCCMMMWLASLVAACSSNARNSWGFPGRRWRIDVNQLFPIYSRLANGIVLTTGDQVADMH